MEAVRLGVMQYLILKQRHSFLPSRVFHVNRTFKETFYNANGLVCGLFRENINKLATVDFISKGLMDGCADLVGIRAEGPTC